MAESTTWTREREELLRELHGSGLTFGEIAQRLGGVSRNAVIGKANRLGLRFKPAARPGLTGEAKARPGKSSATAAGKRAGSTARPARAGAPVPPPKAPEAPRRPPRAPEFRVLDKYYSGRKRRSAARKPTAAEEGAAAPGVLQKYFAAKEKAARARRARWEREERALIRAREVEAARALREAEREEKARAREERAKAALLRAERARAPAAGHVSAVPPLTAAGPGLAADMRSKGAGAAASASGALHAGAEAALPGADGSPAPREPLRLPLVALTDSTCRWPLGDPEAGDFAFCGLPALPRKPYCEDHAKLAYQPMASRRPREREPGK